ncbi:MAG: nucleoside recognition domain-containing protein [Cloacibacillus evryensis]
MAEKRPGIIDLFVSGARRGFNISMTGMLPNVVMAFVIIRFLDMSGFLPLISKAAAPVMALFGLPGDAMIVLVTGFAEHWRRLAARPRPAAAGKLSMLDNMTQLLPVSCFPGQWSVYGTLPGDGRQGKILVLHLSDFNLQRPDRPVDHEVRDTRLLKRASSASEDFRRRSSLKRLMTNGTDYKEGVFMDSLSNFKDRIRKKSLLSKIMSPEEASQYIQPNMLIGCSGFTPVGYPKVIPAALAKRAETEGPVPLTLWCGASSGREIDEELASSGCIKRRYPYQSNKVMRSMINEGKIEYSDIHLSMGGQNLRYGFYGKMDVALIEAAAITENGGIVPSTAVGDAAAYVRCANKVIIEINLTQPAELEGMHDIFIPQDPPYRKPLPLRSVRDRIGVPFIECGAGKILGIVPLLYLTAAYLR